MRNLVKPARVVFLAAMMAVLLIVYIVFLYQLQIVLGETYYNATSELQTTKRTVTAARGNILDRYGRVLVSNTEVYNLQINTDKLFASDDPNGTILELVRMVSRYGDYYTDDLPITTEPPFEFDPNMTDIQRTMLNAYIKDKGKSLPANPTAVDLMSYMRSRYNIDNSYTAEEMRIIAGVRYSINVRYAINTADYVFVQDASMELISSILENKLVGIEISRAYIRDYHTEYAAHILGYVGLMTQDEYERYSLVNYSPDSFVGKDGIEYSFEDFLHGENGTVLETKTPSGTVLATVYEKEPEPGNHIYLTIDLALQEQVERILGNGVNALIRTREIAKEEAMMRGEYNPEMKDEITGAAAVVVDVRTGEPLAMASWPTYDPSNVIENYEELMKAPNTPLFNRVLLGAYAPGSTFKPCTSIAALDSGIINTEDKIKCQGVYTKYAAEGYSPECWIWSSYQMMHPEDNVTDALRDSCNYFFYTVGEQLGVDALGDYARKFGLGEYTGIELIETKGNMSNRANHYDYAGSEWRIGDTMQAAIGQSDSVFTPLQLAEYCAAVANSGTRHSASILKSVRSFDFSEELFVRKTEVLSTIETGEFNWDAVHKGMWKVLNDPLNQQNYEEWLDCRWTAGGKTGTAQKGENIANDGIFICYAPFDDPQVAIAIVVERGRSGASVQFMARQIMDVYINIQSFKDTSESEMTLLR